MKKYLLLAVFLLAPLSQVHATVLYVDFTCATDGIGCGNGTATTTPYSSLDQFSEVARTAGDIAFVKNGVASTSGIANTLTFSSGGTVESPIVMSADYDNLWNAFSTTTESFTVTAGTTTMTANTSITDIATSTIIYVQGDCFETYNAKSLNPCVQDYMVRSISGTILTLWTPYKGGQSGAGLFLRNIGSRPQRGAISGGWNLTGSRSWVMKGLDFRGASAAISVSSAGVNNLFLSDNLWTDNGANATCFSATTNVQIVTAIFRRVICNTISTTGNFFIAQSTNGISGTINIFDSLLEATSSTNGIFVLSGAPAFDFWQINIFDTQADLANNSAVYTLATAATNDILKISTRNLLVVPKTAFKTNSISALTLNISLQDEDWQGRISENRFFNYTTEGQMVSATSTLMSTTSALLLRSGGGPVSIQVNPGTHLATTSEYAWLKLFDYPIYIDTSAKTYNVYFMSTSTAQWTANPLVDQLWIECDEWASGTGEATTTRRIIKSTGTVNFTGSTAWQNLSVTCIPTQSGILYLRGFYAKPFEGAGKLDQFYIDGTPTIQ